MAIMPSLKLDTEKIEQQTKVVANLVTQVAGCLLTLSESLKQTAADLKKIREGDE